jgi:MerR family transcriptional regulator, light-induced transcriptional regulator
MKPREEIGVAIPISAVERETALSKDTLRMWERRYGFPSPIRDQFGDRIYPHAQVEKLRLIRRLMDKGYRPGKIIPQPYHALLELLSGSPPLHDSFNQSDFITDLLRLISEHRVSELRSTLQSQVQNLGLRKFILEVAAPMTRAVGEAWFRGELAIFEEHLFTEVMQSMLRKWTGEARSTEQRAPRILLTTFPNEQHVLGLLMVEVLMAMEGAECISFGIQMPIADIVSAVAAHQADIVALSFSQAYPRTRSSDGIMELRRALQQHIEIWVGGGGVARIKRLPEKVLMMNELANIPAEIARWRQKSDFSRLFT